VSASGGYRVDIPDSSFAVSKLEAALAGTAAGQKIDARIASPELVVAKDQAKGELTANLKSDDIQANLRLAGLEGSSKALVVSQLTGDVAMKAMKATLNGSLRADLEKESAGAELTAKLDESNIKAKLGLAKFSPPAYRFDVAIDQLNLDKYFPPEQPAAGQPPAAPQPSQKGQAETPID
jgi:hypothetical protein